MSKRIHSEKFGSAEERNYEASGDLENDIPYSRWTTGFRIKYSDFSAAGTSEEINLGAIPAGVSIEDIEVDLVEAFDAAVTLTAATLEVGDGDDPDGLLAGLVDLDLNASPTTGLQNVQATDLGAYLYNGTNKYLRKKSYPAAKTLKATLTVTGDNLADMDQGEVIVYVKASKPGAAKVFEAGDSAIS